MTTTSEWAADLKVQIAEASAATRRAMDEALATFQEAYSVARKSLNEAIRAA